MRATEPVTRPSVLSQNKVELIATNIAEYKTVAPAPKEFNPFRATMDELHKYHLPHCPDPGLEGRGESMAKGHVANPDLRRALTQTGQSPAPGITWKSLEGQTRHPVRLGGDRRERGEFHPGMVHLRLSQCRRTQRPDCEAGRRRRSQLYFQRLDRPGRHGRVRRRLPGGRRNGSLCSAGARRNRNQREHLSVDRMVPARHNRGEFSRLARRHHRAPDSVSGRQRQQFQASVHFSNLTTGVDITPIILSAPYGTLKKDDALYKGNTAEWIVEPTAYANGVYSAIADFGDLIFVDAGALSSRAARRERSSTPARKPGNQYCGRP